MICSIATHGGVAITVVESFHLICKVITCTDKTGSKVNRIKSMNSVFSLVTKQLKSIKWLHCIVHSYTYHIYPNGSPGVYFLETIITYVAILTWCVEFNSTQTHFPGSLLLHVIIVCPHLILPSMYRTIVICQQECLVWCRQTSFLVWVLSLAVQEPSLKRVWDKSSHVLELRPTSYAGSWLISHDLMHLRICTV